MSDYHFYPFDKEKVIASLGKEKLLEAFHKMLLIRNFETRAEASYLQGKIGGFFHSYIGQEAVQTAALLACGEKNWWITSYRCHALALLLGATPEELMSELFGRANGNAKGRGGSMHLYTDRLLGGFGIVGGQVPIATGAAFTISYKEIKDEIALCFMGDGAVAQGAVYEAFNLAALYKLPCLFVIENNEWSMGTHLSRSHSVTELAEKKAPAFGMEGYTLDGMDFLSCYAGFSAFHEKILEAQKPILVEVITQRFKGHSVSDPGLYRTKEDLKCAMERDPIQLLKSLLIEKGWLDEESYKALDKQIREKIVKAVEHADSSPWPDLKTLEQDVFSP
jgi:pyruvate dehydrogenase E1 component alpha subunit